MNKVILIGRLVKDPELRYTTSNIPVVQFTLAVNRNFVGKGQERQADFISCVAWRNLAENLAKFMKKGSQIAVEGQIQVRNFEDAGGVRRYVTEVICDNIHFLESKSSRSSDNFSGYSDINQYDIPDTRNNNTDSTNVDDDPFKDIQSAFGVSNDDLPF